METLSSPGGKMTDYYKALTTEAPSVNVNRIEFTMSLKIANLSPGDATATSGREPREQNCPCFQGWRDGILSFSPVNHRSSIESWASVRSCVQKIADSAFLQVYYVALKRC